MVNFAKREYIGTKVFDPRYGNGTIVDIKDNVYNVVVEFRNALTLTTYYLPDGKLYMDDAHPSLCWGHREPLDQGEPPQTKQEVEPKPLKFEGIPVWAYVGNVEGAWRLKTKRLVIASSDKRILTIADGLSNEDTIITKTWKYAWVIDNE